MLLLISVRGAAVAALFPYTTLFRSRWAVVVAMDELLAALVSSAGLEAVTVAVLAIGPVAAGLMCRSEEHTSELQSRGELVWRLMLEAEFVHPALAETKLT